jgi:hypothetical protein
MKRYLKLAFYYLKIRLVARLRKRFLIKVLQQEDSQLLSDLDQVGLPVKSRHPEKAIALRVSC